MNFIELPIKIYFIVLIIMIILIVFDKYLIDDESLKLLKERSFPLNVTFGLVVMSIFPLINCIILVEIIVAQIYFVRKKLIFVYIEHKFNLKDK